MQAGVAAAHLGRSKYLGPSGGGEDVVNVHNRLLLRAYVELVSLSQFAVDILSGGPDSLGAMQKTRDPWVQMPPKNAVKTSETNGKGPKTELLR